MCLMTLPSELGKVLETGSDAGQCGPAAGIMSECFGQTTATRHPRTQSWHSVKL